MAVPARPIARRETKGFVSDAFLGLTDSAEVGTLGADPLLGLVMRGRPTNFALTATEWLSRVPARWRWLARPARIGAVLGLIAVSLALWGVDVPFVRAQWLDSRFTKVVEARANDVKVVDVRLGHGGLPPPPDAPPTKIAAPFGQQGYEQGYDQSGSVSPTAAVVSANGLRPPVLSQTRARVLTTGPCPPASSADSNGSPTNAARRS